MKKVAEKFGGSKDTLYLCTVKREEGSPPPAPPRGGEMEKVEFESRKLKIGCARRLTLEI